MKSAMSKTRKRSSSERMTILACVEKAATSLVIPKHPYSFSILVSSLNIGVRWMVETSRFCLVARY
jgi:hypothetical protein